MGRRPDSPVHAQGGLVFVCGSRDGLMQVSSRKHNTDDVIATVLAVEPMKFIYRGRQVELGRGPAGTPPVRSPSARRIAVFSVKVLRDERICVVAEQRPDCTEEEVCLADSFWRFWGARLSLCVERDWSRTVGLTLTAQWDRV